MFTIKTDFGGGGLEVLFGMTDSSNLGKVHKQVLFDKINKEFRKWCRAVLWATGKGELYLLYGIYLGSFGKGNEYWWYRCDSEWIDCWNSDMIDWLNMQSDNGGFWILNLWIWI